MSTETMSPVEASIHFHYDLPPEFFQLFLDPTTKSYTCAYFRDADMSLDDAQVRKLELVSRKLQLQPGDHVLDLGAGWGNFTFHAVEKGCRVTGITLSNEGARYITEEAERRGVSERVTAIVGEALLLPFADESFDKVVSIGSSEQFEDIPTVMAEAARVLKPGGLLVHHAMTGPIEPQTETVEENFIRDWIFPMGRFKKLTEYIEAFEKAGFEVIDVHNITDHYAHTLHAWLRNLEHNGLDAALAMGVPAERWHAQRLFCAGGAVMFSESHIFCYQQVCQKVVPGAARKSLRAGREMLSLDDGPSEVLRPPVYDNPLVQLRAGDSLSMWVEGRDGMLQQGEPPRRPDCILSISAETLQRVVSGNLSVVDAYIKGAIAIDGDLVAAAQARNALFALAG